MARKPLLAPKLEYPPVPLGEKLLCTKDAADLLNISHLTIQDWRTRGIDNQPPSISIQGVHYYSKTHLEIWLNGQRSDRARVRARAAKEAA